MTNGKEHVVTVNDAYIKTSIFDPDHDVVKGLPRGVMKSYKGLISDDEIVKITEYFKSIK